jgi:adenosylcobinamide-phosphate synthase
VTVSARAIAGALALDLALGEGRLRWHPVALAGAALDAALAPWRRSGPGAQLLAGAGAVAAVSAGAAVAAWAAERAARRAGPAGWLGLAVALKPTFALRQLLEEGLAVAACLEDGRLDDARWTLRALVSRPAADLPAELVASAAIESLAENLADSVAAPLLAFALFGLPGAAVYRVVNTADAMVGYRGELEWLGKAAARGDDVLSWAPSRLSALALAAAAGPAAGRALAAARREGGSTASPNAGRPMAAMAGALDRRLEKRGHYVLGAGRPAPSAADVRRAVRLTALAAALLAGAAIALAGLPARLAVPERPHRPRMGSPTYGRAP